MNKYSLRLRFLLALIAIFVMVGLVGTLINYGIARHMLSRYGERYTAEILRAKRAEFDRTFRRNIDASVFLAKSSLIRKWLSREEDTMLGELALELTRETKEIVKETDVFVVAEGSRRFYLNGKFVNTISADNPDDSWFFMTRNAKPFNFNVDHNEMLKKTKLWVNVLVTNGSTPLGVIGTGLDISTIIGELLGQISEGARVCVFDGQGYIKAHGNGQYIETKKIGELVSGVDIPALQRRLEHDRDQGLVVSCELVDEGRAVSGSFTFMRSTGWYMMVTMDVGTILSAIFVPFIAMLIASLLIVSSVLMYLVNRMVLRPLGVIGAGLAGIRDNDYATRIVLERQDEFGVVANTVNMMTGSIRDHTENLESLVDERTRELKFAFNEVQSLKIQQDGDYFLTSLLINPLLVHSVESERIIIESRLSQKKKFCFRTHDGEIGGDVCIARQIVIHDKRYTAFVNGDAMGKSLQGAGGALVLGVIFNAYVNRSHALGSANHPYPEKWLRQCYTELQSVFTSFDGSMMVSVIIGLFDEESGQLFYFNAEHPYAVLYRDGQAGFLERELSTQKIGSFGSIQDLKLHTFAVRPGDVLVFGSDGRDDILLGHDALTGARKINEDETLFLRIVERGGGRLDGIVEHLAAAGELTDDLSLMRIECVSGIGELPAGYAARRDAAIVAMHAGRIESSLAGLRVLAGEHPDQEAFRGALGCCQRLYRSLDPETQRSDAGLGVLRVQAEIIEDASRWFPLDKEFMYRRAYTQYLLGNAEQAQEYAERFRLYFPEHVGNLMVLVETALRLRKTHKAGLVLDDLTRCDPGNVHLEGFRARLEALRAGRPGSGRA